MSNTSRTNLYVWGISFLDIVLGVACSQTGYIHVLYSWFVNIYSSWNWVLEENNIAAFKYLPVLLQFWPMLMVGTEKTQPAEVRFTIKLIVGAFLGPDNTKGKYLPLYRGWQERKQLYDACLFCFSGPEIHTTITPDSQQLLETLFDHRVVHDRDCCTISQLGISL